MRVLQRIEHRLQAGRILEDAGTRANLHLALEQYDAGLCELRALGQVGDERPLSGTGDGAKGWAGELAARLWMNRGNALLALAGALDGEAALESYGRAGAWLAGQDPGRRDLWPMRGALALNRAAAWRVARGDAGRAEAMAELEQATGWLEAAVGTGHGAARRNLASAWANRADWLERDGNKAGAGAAWARVLAVLEPATGEEGAVLPELRARLGLASGWVGDSGRMRELDEQVEAGLRIAEGAPECGEVGRCATMLFELGAWSRRVQRPAELAAYLERHYARGGEGMREAARRVLGRAREDVLRRDFRELAGERGAEARRWLESWRALDADWAAQASTRST